MPVNAGTIFSEVRILVDKLKGDISKVEAEFNKLGADSKKRSEGFAKNWGKALEKINLTGVAAIAGLNLAVKQAIGIFVEFEQGIANVAAVSGAAGEELEKLEKTAREAGATTRFSAREAADALFFLASAGLNATQSAEALNGVLSLASATGSDLAFTAETLTSTLSQFNLQATEAERVSNIFAAANSNSQATVEKLSTALRSAGPVANAFGVGLEEVVGNLQVLFNAGLRGERAGVALRNVLGELADKTGPTVKRLTELGLQFKDLDPAAVGLTGAIDALAKANLTAGEVTSVFGRDAAAVLTLIKAGKSDIDEFTKAVTGTNAAEEAAAKQLNTLKGDLDIFNSTLQETAIGLTKELSPALRFFVNIGKGFLDVLNALPGPIKLFLAILATGVPVVTAAAIAIKTFGAAIGGVLGPITAIVAAAGAVITIIGTLAGEAAKFNKVYEESNKILDENNDLLDRGTATLDEYDKGIKKASDELDKLNKQLDENKFLFKADELLIRENVAALEKQKAALEEARIAQVKFNKELATAIDRQIKNRKVTIDQAIAQLEYARSIFLRTVGETALAKTFQVQIDRLQKLKKQQEIQNAELKKQQENTKATKEETTKLNTVGLATVQAYKTLSTGFRRTSEESQKAKESIDEQKTSLLDYFNEATSLAQDFSGLFSALGQARIEELDRQLQAELEAAGVAEETNLQSLERELAAAKEKGDEEVIKEKEDAIKREQITIEFEKKKAQAAYDAAIFAWGVSLIQAGANVAEGITKAVASAPFPLNAPAIAFATASGGAQIGTILAKKPQPPSFQTGGLVLPSSGGNLVNVAENGNPELLFNSGNSGRRFLDAFAQRVAEVIQSQGGNATIIINMDGRNVAKVAAPYYNNGIVRLNV